jgi:2-hydroxy-3-oxopropionate reductase
MVPDSADSEAAILGPNGVLEGASESSVVIDMSSIAPASSQKIAAACESQGVAFLDAPVSGGEPGAISGTLAIMVGGKQEVFDAHLEMLEVVGASIVLCGDYGAGNTTKLANQIIVAANIEAVGEALTLAVKAGLDPSTVFDAIKGGLAGSNVLNAKGPMMIAGNFEPGFRIALHNKDLNNAIQTGKELGVGLPVTSLVQQMIVSLMNEGKGSSDHSAIANFIEDMAGVKISGE